MTFTIFETNVEKTVVYEKVIFNTINQQQHNISEVIRLLQAMQSVIQENIDYAYMYIDAKQSFSMLQKTSDIELETFWFSEDEASDGKTLFVSSKAVGVEDIDRVFELEDSLTEMLQKIGEHKKKILDDLSIDPAKVDVFDFDAVSRQHFARVSFL